MSLTALSGRINGLKLIYTGWEFRMWPLVALTKFSYNKMYGSLDGKNGAEKWP